MLMIMTSTRGTSQIGEFSWMPWRKDCRRELSATDYVLMMKVDHGLLDGTVVVLRDFGPMVHLISRFRFREL